MRDLMKANYDLTQITEHMHECRQLRSDNVIVPQIKMELVSLREQLRSKTSELDKLKTQFHNINPLQINNFAPIQKRWICLILGYPILRATYLREQQIYALSKTKDLNGREIGL